MQGPGLVRSKVADCLDARECAVPYGGGWRKVFGYDSLALRLTPHTRVRCSFCAFGLWRRPAGSGKQNGVVVLLGSFLASLR